MTNLTDLLPAGAGGKQVSFTASGAISSGQTVALNSDGTVSVISGNGSVVEYEDGSVRGQTASGIFDSANNKVIVSYSDSGDTNKGKAVVGTVSGLSISFGTPVQFHAGATYYGGISFDTNAGKCLIVYLDGDTNQTEAIVGTVSGTSISFGTAATVTTNYGAFPAVAYDSTAQKHLVTYRDDNDSSIGKAKVATISGTSVSFGSEATFEPGRADAGKIAYDANAQKLVVSYYDADNSSYGTSAVGTISGTSVSFGTPVVFRSATTSYLSTSYDANAQKVVIAYNDGASTYLPKAIVGTVSGTSITFGAAASLGTVPVNGAPSVAYNPDTQKHTIVWGNQQSPYQVYQVTATVSGTSISATSAIVIYDAANGAGPEPQSLVYDTNSDKMVLQMRKGSTDEGIAFVLNSSFVPASSFLGIADAAISDTASGNITIKGGIAGTVAYDSGIGAETSFDNTAISSAITYDANAQKVVVFYDSSDNSSYGYGVVGTISGTSSSWGSSGSANTSGFVQWVDIVYDSNAQKVVAVYNNGTLSDHGYAVVGTVSGTSISWGTPVKYESAGVYYNAIVYDSNSQKVVISYYDAGNSNYGTSIVGTVSGTSISFGTAVVFNSASTFGISSAFDSVNNKVVNAYRDVGSSNEGRAVVGTVSGTSISFGSDVAFNTTSNTPITATTFDANAGKIVIAYRSDPSNEGKAIVGTVSGTSISFGTEATFSTSTMGSGERYIAAEYDPSTQTVLIGFRDEGDSNYGKTIVGTVSGTSISFASEETFSSAATLAIDFAYDSNAQKMIVIYRNASGVGQSRVYTPDTTLTPNTTYYVQSDGSLSTTSSSVTAGKALSATSINLDYSS